MTQNPEENRQAGIPLPEMGEEPPKVAHGDRRAEVRYESDPDQLVKVRFTEKPLGPLPPEEQSTQLSYEEDRSFSATPPVEDVAVSTSPDSVWDARPPEDEPERTGGPPPR